MEKASTYGWLQLDGNVEGIYLAHVSDGKKKRKKKKKKKSMGGNLEICVHVSESGLANTELFSLHNTYL